MKTIFVSSTFKDMHHERDVLQDKVLPRLNMMAAHYNEHVAFCDLRWGIDTSDVDSEKGAQKVLTVCLDEIDRCAPYMIVILGDRYGWIPSEKLIEDTQKMKQMKLDHLKKSVTALEIEYGALNSAKKGRTLFYFREFIDDVPDQYKSEDQYHEQLLSELKQRIDQLTDSRIKKYQIGYKDGQLYGLDEFSEMLIHDVSELLKPEWEKNLVLSQEERQRQIHFGFVHEKAKAFKARKLFAEELIHRILKKEPRLVIKAEPGSGKSTLLSALTLELQRRGFDVLPLICGLTPESNTAFSLLKQIVYYLESKIGFSHIKDELMTMSVQEWKDRLESLVIEYKVRKQHVVILVDALDQLMNDEDRDHLIFLPDQLSEHVQIVMTCLTDFPTFDMETTEFPALTEQDRLDVIEGSLSVHNRELSDAAIKALLKKSFNQTPLYLSFLIQRLLMMNAEDFHRIDQMGGTMKAIETHHLALIESAPDSLGRMSMEVLNAAGERVNPELADEALKLISISRYGLRAEDLAGLLKGKYNALDFLCIVSYMSDSFILRSDGRYDFSHKSIREGYLQELKHHEQIHQQIFAYLNTLDPKDEIRSKELVYHAISADEKQFLVDYVKEHKKDNDLITIAAKDLYDYTMHVDESWLLELLSSDDFACNSSFAEMLAFDFEYLFNGNLKDSDKMAQIRFANCEYARKCNEIDKTDQSKRILAVCLENTGIEYNYSDQLDQATEAYEEALRLRQELEAGSRLTSRKKSVMKTIRHLAHIYYRKNECIKAFSFAVDALNKALELVKENPAANDYMNVADCYESLAVLFSGSGHFINMKHRAIEQHQKALDYIEKARELSDDQYYQRKTIVCYQNLSDLYDDAGRYKDEQKRKMYLKRAVDIAESLLKQETSVENYELVRNCYLKLIHVYIAIADEDSLDQAWIVCEKCLKIAQLLVKEVGRYVDYYALAAVLFDIAAVLYEKKEYEQSMITCQKMLDVLSSVPELLKNDDARVYNLMGDIYRIQKKDELANQYYQKFLDETSMKDYYPNMYHEMQILFEHIDDQLMEILPYKYRISAKYLSSRLFHSMIDLEKTLEEQYLLPETETLLTYFYDLYWTSEKEEDELFELLCQQEEKNGSELSEARRLKEMMKTIQIP